MITAGTGPLPIALEVAKHMATWLDTVYRDAASGMQSAVRIGGHLRLH